MEAILVVTLSIDKPKDVAAAIKAIDPVNLPHFGGIILVAIDEPAREVVKWLSEGQEEKIHHG